MVEKLSLSLLTPPEMADTANRYRQVMVDEGVIPAEGDTTTAPISPYVALIFNMLKNDQKQLNSALVAVKSNILVPELTEADAVRDDAYIVFKDAVKVANRRRKAEIVKARELVWPVIKSTGTNIYRLGMASKSGRLNALFEELEGAGFPEALATLGVETIYQELTQAQQDFELIYDQRINKDLQIKYPTLREAKSGMSQRLMALQSALGILEISEPENFTSVNEKLNVITNEIMAVARARDTRKESEDEEEVLIPEVL